MVDRMPVININVMHRWKVHVVGYNSVADSTVLSPFVQPLLPSKITKSREIMTKFRPYSSSRLSKVIDLGVNRKSMCNFLLVINSNFGPICYPFRDIDVLSQKMPCFSHPSLVWRSRSGWPLSNFVMKFGIKKIEIVGQPDGEEIMI